MNRFGHTFIYFAINSKYSANIKNGFMQTTNDDVVRELSFYKTRFNKKNLKSIRARRLVCARRDMRRWDKNCKSSYNRFA